MTLFEALQPDSPYVFYSDDHGFCINTADVMDIITMDKEIIVNGNCMLCGKSMSGNRLFLCEGCSEKGADDDTD